ncbi:hypothetical protein [Geomicrobium sp. JCM 19055]|uniref:hypothetical protein n=1 Tax=Geomicrobium sp. JCM 19055 TaxID=1460649 RepID=UPI00045ECF29|nr:hypothetical protein [Geomicrobium sp. JCM 19055]GAK00103.1 hypothetical protein JCM19055_3172 [Geomicrobium sp. JCM 19055]
MDIEAWSIFAIAFIIFANFIVHSLLKGTIEKYRLRVISSVIVSPGIFLYWGTTSTHSSLFLSFYMPLLVTIICIVTTVYNIYKMKKFERV